MFRTHEETGRKAIYVNRLMTQQIEGLPQAESDALLEALFDHSEKPEFVYRHVWKVGDLLTVGQPLLDACARRFSIRPAPPDAAHDGAGDRAAVLRTSRCVKSTGAALHGRP